MRTMPTVISTDPYEGTGAIEIRPTPRAEFLEKLEKIGQRPLTASEHAWVERAMDHNWTLRVVASELFGEQFVDDYFAPKK